MKECKCRIQATAPILPLDFKLNVKVFKTKKAFVTQRDESIVVPPNFKPALASSSTVITVLIRPFFYRTSLTCLYLNGNSGAKLRNISEP